MPSRAVPSRSVPGILAKLSSIKGPQYSRMLRKEKKDGRHWYRLYNATAKKELKQSDKNYERVHRLALSVPPAWKDVTISPDDKKYIAHGRHTDKMGNVVGVTKYTKEHSIGRNRAKHCALEDFAKKMEEMEEESRDVVESALKKDGLTKKAIVALVVLLIIQCAFRIGSNKPSSQEDNRGIFYIEKRHVKIRRNHVSINFVGKWSKPNQCDLEDHDVAVLLGRFLKRSNGKHAFVFKNRAIPAASPVDIRAYIKSYAPKGKEYIFSPKSFRNVVIHTRLFNKIQNWARSSAMSPSDRRRSLNAAIKENATLAYHSAAMQRSSYLNPDILDLIIEGDAKTRKIFARSDDMLDVYVKLLERVCD
jgi:DNA topoisomerase IB